MSDTHLTLPGEIWKDIPVAIGYEASNLGRIRSYWNWRNVFSGSFMVSKPRLMRPWSTKLGYKAVRVKISDTKKRNMFVHQLVLHAFVGPPPNGKNRVRHLDRNPPNNKLGNIIWGNQSENYADALGHGTAPLGEAHGQSTLTEEQVLEIVELR